MKKYKNDIFFIILFLFIFFTFSILKPFSFTVIKGESMYPTLKNRDIKVVINNNNYEVGDIITFYPLEKWDKDNKKIYIKRIIAKGGDTITIKNNIIYVNNIKFIQLSPYYRTKGTDMEFDIKDGYNFVVGDNLGNSKDSLNYLMQNNFETDFLIPDENIIGVLKEDSKVKEINDYVKAYNKQE